MSNICTLILPHTINDQLKRHLFPGDSDEHGAVIAAGYCQTKSGIRLLARNLFLAEDGVDYVAGERGYRMLHASFVRDKILFCRNNGLVYLAIHNHRGEDKVMFSDDDMASHKRGYPALLDINRGLPVGALVFANNAVAGDIWISKEDRVKLKYARIVGSSIQYLFPEPQKYLFNTKKHYDRQILLYGDLGQILLGNLKVGIIGAGGVGSLINQYISRLGVGHIVIVDPKRISISNLARVVGATGRNAKVWFAKSKFRIFQHIAKIFSAKKVDIAANVAKAANPDIKYEPIFGDIVKDDVVKKYIDCDFIFLAADSMQSRLIFNALVHQYLIPGVQIGSKIMHDKKTGKVRDIFSVVRPVTSEKGCLFCNELISSEGLQNEALSVSEREIQSYVDDVNVDAPSVITLNAVGVGHAVDDFMLSMIGLTECKATRDYVKFFQRKRKVIYESPRRDKNCSFCSINSKSVLAKGDSAKLPTMK